MHVMSLAAYSDVGNATLVLGLSSGGAGGAFQNEMLPEHWATIIGAAGTNGSVGAAWFNFEPVGAVQVSAPNWVWAGAAAIEIKAETPNTGFTRTVGNGIEHSSVNPEDIQNQCRLFQFTVPDGGVLGSVWAACQHNDSSGGTFGMYLYDASGNLLDTSNTTDAPLPISSYQMLEFTGMTYELAAATTYYLGVASDEFSCRVGRSAQRAYFNGYEITSGFSNLATPPDPATITVDANDDYFIYATYTPSSGTTVIITDVDTDEAWTDGAPGLIITGSGFV